MVAPRQSLRVLHVDDDEMILDFVKQFVAGQDPSLQFTTTTSSKAALDTLHTQTYDCILLDYKMPEMNGIELAQKIRETNKTPIILYTGQGSEEVAEQAYAAGIDDYIRKEAHPAHYQVLARRIRHVIEKHHTDELYRTLVESCPDGCSISRENTFIYTNHVLANLFGFKEPSDVNGKNYLQWLVEEDRQTIINRNRRFEHGETTTEIINYRLRKPSGDVRFIESHGRSVFFEGAPATLAFTRDITHTRKIEEELRDSNERYRAISHRLTSFMNSATDEFVIYDKDLNLIDANDLWLKNHKTNRAEAIGKNARELHPRPIEDKIAEYLQVMRTGEPISYEAVTESFPGNTHQQMIRAFKVGEGVGAILVDVTNFKQMEKALVESEEKYRLLSENARDIIFRYSFTKGFEYVNKAVTKVLGYTLDEIRVSPLLDFNVPIEEEEKLSNLIEKIKTGQIVDSPFRLRFRHKTGHFVTLEFSLQPIVGKDGALESVEGIARDISQSVVYEKKLEALHSHAEAIAQAGYVEEICKATLDIIESVLGFHLLAFMVVSEDGLIAIESRKNRPLGRALPLNGKGISVRAAREKLPMRVADVRLDPDFVKSSTDSLSELAVPVVLEGETVFVINLESTNLNAFTEEDQSLVEILAEHISSAVKKLRLLENERSNREKLEALHHHAVELSSLDNIKEIAKFTLETVDTILGHSYGGFAVVNNERLEFVQSIGIELSRIQPIPIDGKGVTARTVRNGETQYVPDVRLDADYFPDGDGKTQSELDVPIKIDGKTIAVINLESNRLDSYTTEDKRIVEVLAEHVALAIKKLKLLESERQNTTRLEALHNHAVKLSEKEGIDEIASFTLDTIGKILGYSQSAFITIEGNKVRYLHLKDVDPNVLPEMNLEGPGITVRAIKTGKTQLIPDTRNDPDYVKDTNGENRSELDVPIKVDDRVVALINLEDKQPNAFNESDRHIIEILSEHVALAIKRLRLLENERSNAEKLEALNRRAAHLDQSQSVIEAIERACSILNEDFGYNWVGVGRVDEDAIRYVKYIGVTLSGNDLIPFSKNTVTVRAVTTGETQLVRDTTKDTNYILLALVEKPYLSELVVPVKVRGRIEYVLNIESFELDGFSDEARRQIELLALHLGSAFELIRERERLAALHKHAPQIARAKDINEIAQLVLATAGAVFHFPIAGLHVIRGSVIELVFVPGFTENGSFTQTIDGPGLIPYTVREGKSIRIDDVRLNEHYVKGPIGEEVRLSELVVPVKLGDKVIAVINLENSRLAAFTEEDQRMAELLALHVGTAMELIEEKRQIKEQQMAETRELLEGANRISSMVRHDLRGPLQSIKNATFLAEQQPEKSKEMLDAIDKSVDYATKILDDLRNSTSPIKLAKAVTNVNDLVEQSIASASIPGDINVHKSYSEGFIAASLDSTRIRRALDNLIKNAVEAMPRGGDLTVAVKKEGETVQIDVADTGVGIPKEVMESLFRPFFTTKPRGTGLGLAVCRQAVEAHGGTITLTSEPNKGTTFTIRLPLKG